MDNQLDLVFVDDDEGFLNTIDISFEGGDLNIKTALNFDEGVKLIINEKPKVAFIDYELHDQTGQQLLVKLSESYVFQHTVLYLLTGKSFNSEEEGLLKTLGFTDVLYKPISKEAMVEILKKHS